MTLYLDSLVHLKANFYNQYYWPEKRSDYTNKSPYDVVREYSGSDKPLIKQSVWTRLTMPIHCALFLIRAIASQTIRGTGSIIAGVLTLEGLSLTDTKIKSGLTDYLSVIVQTVTLPLIALVAPFSPNGANKILQGCLKYSFESTITRNVNGSKLCDHFISQSRNAFTRGITSLVRGILVGIPVPVIDGLTDGVSQFLKGDIIKAYKKIAVGCIVGPQFNILSVPIGGFDLESYKIISTTSTDQIFYDELL